MLQLDAATGTRTNIKILADAFASEDPANPVCTRDGEPVYNSKTKTDVCYFNGVGTSGAEGTAKARKDRGAFHNMHDRRLEHGCWDRGDKTVLLLHRLHTSTPQDMCVCIWWLGPQCTCTCVQLADHDALLARHLCLTQLYLLLLWQARSCLVCWEASSTCLCTAPMGPWQATCPSAARRLTGEFTHAAICQIGASPVGTGPVHSDTAAPLGHTLTHHTQHTHEHMP